MTDLYPPRTQACESCLSHGPEETPSRQDRLAAHRAWHDLIHTITSALAPYFERIIR